ncbi:MAG: hypothetical protein AAB116_13205, partial [Candidatus Poribacteria bacterium]
MRMSRFQLKLTLIFLLVLLVPAITATLLTKYILTIQSTVMDVDQKAEAVLQETKIIADDIIEKAKEECLFIAQAISDNLTENDVNLDSTLVPPSNGRTDEKIQELVKDIVQPGHQLNAIILSSGNPIIKPKIIFATSNDN